jgi:hypothetical protein
MEFLKGLAESFYSPHFYSNLAHKKPGIGAPYILAVSVLILLFISLIFTQTDFYRNASNFAGAVRTLPTVTLKDGRLSIDKPVPYVFSPSPDMNVVIDTSFKVGDPKALADKMLKDKTFVIITATGMVTYSPDGAKIQDFRQAKDATVTPEGWNTLAQWFEGWRFGLLLIFWAALMLGVLFVGGLIATFFTAIVVVIAGLIARAGLDFEASMRVASAIRVPTTVLMFLPFIGNLVGWMIWFAYLIFAVVSCRVAPPERSV